MANQPPQIDPRTAADIENQLNTLLKSYIPDWKLDLQPDPVKGKPPQGIHVALIKIFARFCEIVIERLNQVPQKNFLAFLDLLGASRLPPQPARAPLTFSLAKGAIVDVVVPKGTQVAAQATGDEKEPVIFETEQDLVVTAAQVASIFAVSLQQCQYDDYSTIIAEDAPIGLPVFQKTQSITIEEDLQSPEMEIETAFFNQTLIDLSTNFFPFGEQPKFGDTLYLANNEVFFRKDTKIALKIKLTDPHNYSSETKITPSSNLILQWEFWDGGKWRLLGISDPNKTQEATAKLTDSTIAFTNFLREGEVKFTLDTDANPKKIKVNGVENFWIRVRIASGKYETSAAPVIQAITVRYTLPAPVVESTSPESDRPSLYFGFVLPTGRKNFPQQPISLFIRLDEPKYNGDSALFSLAQSRQYGKTGESVVHQFNIINNTTASVNLHPSILATTWETVVPLSPINIEAGTIGQLEVQVKIPSGGTASNSGDRGTLQLSTDAPSKVYSAIFETLVDAAVDAELSKAEQPRLSWQYWNGKEWIKLAVSDATKNFTRSGVITFLPPKDFVLREDFGLLLRYWLRVRWESGDYLVEPKLRRVLLNTVMATQIVTVFNEILGSSDGSENQKFHTTRKPVLRGQHLEVRESELLSAQEQIEIKQDEGDDAISPILDANGHPTGEYWVHWHEVPDFYGSGPRARHYVVNHLTGEIGFGNERNGLIPSLSKSNIRMAYYQTGGGKAGNKPADTSVQLKTTVPYVDRVTNYEAATGGAEAETVEALIEQIPRQIRHHDRAVTLEDYEDLAREASVEVARAKCLPLRHLAAHPLDETKVPGTVSVIIVPRSTDANPQPTLELMSHVQDYLEAHIDPTVNVVVVGPLYLKVDITTKLVLTSLENGSTVEQAVEEKLASFLHPLTGGFDGTGWDFGRKPHHSDLYRLLEGVPGVDHVQFLKINDGDKSDVKQTNRFLVYSGKHDISLIFAKA